MSDWEFVKDRTATQGAVWRSADGPLHKRTGGEDLRKETEFQRLATDFTSPAALARTQGSSPAATAPGGGEGGADGRPDRRSPLVS